MPYRTRRTYRARRPKRVTRYRPTRKKKSLAKRVRALEINVERKFIDTPTFIDVDPIESGAWPTLGPQANVINLIPQVNPPTVAASDETRIGDKVTLTSIQVDYTLAPYNTLDPTTNAIPNTTGDPIATLVRFMLVWFPGSGFASADIENVIEAPNTALSFYKRNGPLNYKILADKYHNFTFARPDAAAFVRPIAGQQRVRLLIPLAHQAYYDGLPSRPDKGTLCWFLFHDPQGVTTASPTTAPNMVKAQVLTRLTFDDA